MRIVNLSRQGAVLADRVRVADDFLSRWQGLIGQRPLAAGEGFYLTPCQGVHTLGMRSAVDAVYIDRQGRVLHALTLAPNRLGPWLWACRGILEMPAGSAARNQCRPGDRLAQRPHEGW